MANGNHDCVAQDDFLVLQKTLLGNEPARIWGKSQLNGKNHDQLMFIIGLFCKWGKTFFYFYEIMIFVYDKLQWR